MTDHRHLRFARSHALLSRSSLGLLVPLLREHVGVSVSLFHRDELEDELYRELLEPLDWQDPYLRTAVDDTFADNEVELLREWFAENNPEVEFNVYPANPITENMMGSGAIPVGGSSDSIMFDKAGAPISIWGYYDLCNAKSGLYVDRPEEAEWKVLTSPDGQVVVKQPPNAVSA